MGDFAGFDTAAMSLLETLPDRDAAWFKGKRKDYQRLIADPAKAFVTELGEALKMTISPGIVAEPKTNGSIAPINNDLRFSPDKPPYKDHLLLKFWEGTDKKTVPTLYVRVSSESIGFATGALFPDLERWRKAVNGEAGARLATAISKLSRIKGVEVAGQELKRVPPPFAADHPRADLLRHKMIQVRWPEKPTAALGKPAFVGWCAKRLERCSDVHHWLVEELG